SGRDANVWQSDHSMAARAVGDSRLLVQNDRRNVHSAERQKLAAFSRLQARGRLGTQARPRLSDPDERRTGAQAEGVIRTVRASAGRQSRGARPGRSTRRPAARPSAGIDQKDGRGSNKKGAIASTVRAGGRHYNCQTQKVPSTGEAIMRG